MKPEEIFEELIQTIERNAINNQASIIDVKFWAKSWRDEIQLKNDNLILSAVSLAELVLKILDEKAHRGCDNKEWVGFQNGNGEYVGKDIKRIIIKAKKFLSEYR